MERDYLNFEFKVNLEHLCSLKIAKTVWEKEETKKKVVHFFQESYNKYDEEEDDLIRWNKLTKEVLILLKDLSLPTKLNNKLKHITKSIGIQIFNWVKYVTSILKFDITYAKEIFWTQYGTIDKIKIFKNWLGERKLENFQLFNVACLFCLEEYIPRLWNEIPEEIKENSFYTESIYAISKYNIIAYWKNFLIDNMHLDDRVIMATDDRSRIERQRNREISGIEANDVRRIAWLYIFSNINSTGENMFRISVLEGLELAVKYFWKKLSVHQRERNIQFLMHSAKEKSNEPEYPEILIFLLSKLSIKKNVSLAYQEIFILEILLKKWPWDEFFMPVFHRVLQFYEDSSNIDVNNYETTFFNAIHAIVNMMEIDFFLYENVKGSRYQDILQETWNKIPECVKILVAGKRDWSIFSKLLNVEDFESLKLIINYEGFQVGPYPRRNSLISCMKSLFVSLKNTRKTELVERFVNEIGLDEDEKIRLRIEFLSC